MTNCGKCGNSLRFYEAQEPPICLDCEMKAISAMRTLGAPDRRAELQRQKVQVLSQNQNREKGKA
jgi:hypothetical protein